MKVISGCVIIRDNKILMVKEAKKKCYGQWNYPAGHVDEFEKITDAAIREVFEETGCKVKLKGVLPIVSLDLEKETHILVRFMADILEENIKFDKDEILEVKWIDIEEIKNMTEKELRGYEANLKVIEDIEKNRIYPLEIFDNTKY
jgi:ADP-ribose pyrophosphatase YjhB (NUDIX family)